MNEIVLMNLSVLGVLFFLMIVVVWLLLKLILYVNVINKLRIVKVRIGFMILFSEIGCFFLKLLRYLNVINLFDYILIN